MGPTETWPAAEAAETVELDELLHAVPRLLRLLLKLFLDAAHLRPDRPVHLRHDAVGAAVVRRPFCVIERCAPLRRTRATRRA